MKIIDVEFLREDTSELLAAYVLEFRKGGSQEKLALLHESIEENRKVIFFVIKQFKQIADGNEDEQGLVEDLELQIRELNRLLSVVDHTAFRQKLSSVS